jgi:transposase InsO family protein
MDLCGPLPVESIGGSLYFATFLDDFSRLSVVVPLSSKSAVAGAVQRTLAMLETQSGHKLQSVRTDRGGEYVNSTLQEYFSSKGVLHQTTAAYTPEQNGAAERLNRTLMERVRAMLLAAGLKKELWAEAVVTANYIRNRSPTTKGSNTPWEAFFKRTPNVSAMRVFGARAFVLTPKELRRKLDPVSRRGVFVGYSATSKAYRVMLEDSGQVVESRDVVFIEQPTSSKQNLIDDELTDPVPAPSAAPAAHVRDTASTRQPGPSTDAPAGAGGAGTGAGQDLSRRTSSSSEEGRSRGRKQARSRHDQTSPSPAARYPARERQPPGQWYTANSAQHDLPAGATSAATEPTTEQEALSRPDADMWRRAMDEEMASLTENETW